MAYVKAAPFAWAGWRLDVPGGPEGGQYHGLLAGGTALHEGQTVSDHVYRSPGEVRPRANASGGTNVARGHLGGLGLPVTYGSSDAVIMMPARTVSAYGQPRVSPLPPIVMMPPIAYPGTFPGTTPQPPPPVMIQPSPIVPIATPVPISPAPAPVVNAPSTVDMMPTTATGSTVSATPTTSLSDWLSASTIWSGVSNQTVVLGAVGLVAAFMMFGGRKR